MARMFPSTISPHTQSPAEKLLFRELERQLSSEWIVMHSVGWITRARRRDEHGEADFVILHPKYGVIVIEVKGGTLHGEWSSEDWVSTNRHGRDHRVKNPFTQAQRAQWSLKRKLDESPGTSKHTYWIVCGVAFPDMLLGDQPFGPDFHRSMTIDSTEMGTLESALTGMFAAPLKQPMASRAVGAFTQLLQPVIEISRPGLVAEVLDGEAHILRLTEEQQDVLGLLQHQRRAVIDGCAGSGKTMLAMEKATQLASEGFDVLLTCYNRNLANWMNSIIAAEPPEIAGRIRVRHYHDLAVQFCEEAGQPSVVRADDPDYWNVGLSLDLLAVIPHLETRFDAIVADEGQDFDWAWWETLIELLRDPEDGVFYIFRDEQQDLYNRDSELPFPSLPFPLQGNLRNSQAIHEVVTAYWDGDPKPYARGPEGREIEIVTPGDRSTPSLMRTVLHRLTVEEGLRPDQIVVLTPNSRANSALDEGGAMGNLSLTWEVEPEPRQVRISSIHGFKGLESDVVVLVETDRLAEHRAGPGLVYVALSRAKHHLIVIGSLPPV